MTRSRSCLHSPITPNFNASALHSPVYDQAALVASGWAAYLQLVYGDFSRLEYPFSPGSLSQRDISSKERR